MRIAGKKNVSGSIEKAKKIVDEKAEAARLAITTSGSIVQSVYQHKIEEARAVVNGATGSFPLLEAEAETRGKSIDEVAQDVLIALDQWKQKMAQIESWRFSVMMQINESNDTRDIERLADEAIFTG